MSTPTPVAEAVLELARTVETEAAGSMFATRAAAIRERLEGPLRVAIAGRVKAGKSTLLNALVGERLAPTDAGEWSAELNRSKSRSTSPSGTPAPWSRTRTSTASPAAVALRTTGAVPCRRALVVRL